MDSLSPEILSTAKDIVYSLGGIDNISRITAGRSSLLTISVHHLEYIKTTKLKLIPYLQEFIIADSQVTLQITDIPIYELEMAIRLYEGERRVLEAETDSEEYSAMQRLFPFLQAAFTPLLSTILAGGFLQVLLILLMTSGLYTMETNNNSMAATISGGVYYFLPVLVAWSLARYYRTNPYIAGGIAGILIHPEVSAFISGPILSSFFGIGALTSTFPNSILPILFIVPLQAKLDHYLSSQLNDTQAFFIKPFLLLAHGTFIGILLLGPVMTLVGNATLAGIMFLSRVVPWLVAALIAAFGPIFVLLGAHYPLLPLVQERLATVGYETILAPGFLAMNMAHAGVALAVMMKTRKKAYRTFAGTSAILSLLGVSQATLYGLEVPLRAPLFHAMIGGAVGGLYAGIAQVKAYALLNPSILSVSAFQNGESNINLIHVGIAVVLSFSVSFLLTWRTVLYEPTDMEIKQAAAATDRERMPYS